MGKFFALEKVTRLDILDIDVIEFSLIAFWKARDKSMCIN